MKLPLIKFFVDASVLLAFAFHPSSDKMLYAAIYKWKASKNSLSDKNPLLIIHKFGLHAFMSRQLYICGLLTAEFSHT